MIWELPVQCIHTLIRVANIDVVGGAILPLCLLFFTDGCGIADLNNYSITLFLKSPTSPCLSVHLKLSSDVNSNSCTNLL